MRQFLDMSLPREGGEYLSVDCIGKPEEKIIPETTHEDSEKEQRATDTA